LSDVAKGEDGAKSASQARQRSTGVAASRLFYLSRFTYHLSLLTPGGQYVDDGFEYGVAGVFVVAVFVEGALRIGGYYGDG
jgi:hypothetical protein